MTQWTERDNPQASDATNGQRARAEEAVRLARKRTKNMVMGGLLALLIAGAVYFLFLAH